MIEREREIMKWFAMRVISPFGSDDTLLAAPPPMAGRRA